MELARRILIATLLSSGMVCGQTPQLRGTLTPGSSIDGSIQPGALDEYRVTLTAGSFARLVAHQSGADVIITVLDPFNKRVAAANRNNGSWGPEPISFIAEQPGVYRIVVSCRKGSDIDMAYRMEFSDLRPPTAADRMRIDAESAQYRASLQTQPGTRESKLAAISLYDRAASLWRQTPDPFEEGLCLVAAGELYKELGDNAKARDLFIQSLPLFHKAGDQNAEALGETDLFAVYLSLGDQEKAMDAYMKSMQLRMAGGSVADLAATMGPIRELMASSNDGGAKTALAAGFAGNGALTGVFNLLGDHSQELRSLIDAGVAYRNAGDRTKSLDTFQKALDQSRSSGDKTNQGRALSELGSLYSAMGQDRKALDSLNQALPLIRATGDQALEATTLGRIGVAWSNLADYAKAIAMHSESLTLARKTGNKDAEAAALDSLGLAHFRLEQTRQALESYSLALPLTRAAANRSREASVLDGISRVYEKSQPQLAIVFAKQAVNLLQSLREDNNPFFTEELRKTYQHSIEEYYRHLAGLLVGRGRFGEAEDVLNLLKDEEAAAFIRRDAVADQLKATTLLDSEKQALDRYEKLITQIVTEGQKKSALVAKAARAPLDSADAALSEQLDRDLSAANTVLLRYFDEEGKAFAAASGTARRLSDLRESEGLQDTLQALGPDVAAIYTLILPDRYTALLVTSGARKAYSTKIAESELDRDIFDFRRQLENPATDPRPLAQKLYRILFPEGLRADLDAAGVKTIMWSIDGPLRYLPFPALHDGHDYLVKSFRNSLITPASLPRLLDASQSEWKGVGFGVSEAKDNFGALPSVPAELRGIFRTPDNTGTDAPVPGSVHLNSDFTRTSFLAAMRQPDKSVVHIATHFDSRPGVAADSRLLFGDGAITLAEIEAMPRLFSGVDLLTLSACSTAFTNTGADGREVDSLGTIAQRLGARGVIASLWNVSDDATARLMEKMYRIRQAHPELGKSEALRQAQEQMASGTLKASGEAEDRRGSIKPLGASRSHDWTHPYYWAPFILIGNWR
jgi:CHAT domain-containing protein